MYPKPQTPPDFYKEAETPYYSGVHQVMVGDHYETLPITPPDETIPAEDYSLRTQLAAGIPIQPVTTPYFNIPKTADFSFLDDEVFQPSPTPPAAPSTPPAAPSTPSAAPSTPPPSA